MKKQFYFQNAIAFLAFCSPFLAITHPEYIHHSERLSLLGLVFLLKTPNDNNEHKKDKKDKNLSEKDSK